MNSWDLGPTQLNESEVHEGCLSLQQQHNHVHPEVLPSTVVMLLLMAVKGRRDGDGTHFVFFNGTATAETLETPPAFFSSLLRRLFDWIKGGGGTDLMSLNIVRGTTKAIKRGLKNNPKEKVCLERSGLPKMCPLLLGSK